MHVGFELQTRMDKYLQARCGKAWKTTWRTSRNDDDFRTGQGFVTRLRTDF
ncbi:hypothetical protein HanRHA438_Chr13g0606111 [Helianthus annuus]|uniref:Uncharacterized protein n=1 Tax=Helianthus annuus TaxID=4232 RepID=A0A9K3EIU5_HELAN|nr:hypothetical protein HanXRQr2_Chr13g0595391 [Helianthus annuus]KAJ0849832.1 hypothetical protein HanPSC8_Chr13g0573471 [Helianthus annuus]KAJ0858876.1 hypothetical protein HanRHA438_Chr13g0606111 [Helianthus annuus]